MGDVANHHDHEIDRIHSDTFSDQIPQRNSRLGIRHVLSQNETFDVFMLHIAKEFSNEILLCYVEFTQLLSYLFEHYDHMISRQVHDEEINETLVNFPSTVPMSYIISTATATSEIGIDDKSKEDVLLLVLFIGSSLYNRYVKKGADLEINISSQLRRRFVAMFTGHNDNDDVVNIDLNEVIKLFVDANKAMYRLLGYSFA